MNYSSIAVRALVYKSTAYAAHIYEQVQRYCPGADFQIIANDATPEVLNWLVKNDVPHLIQDNKSLSAEGLLDLGIGEPEYIRRVYQGWNRCIMSAREFDMVMLVNSDHCFSHGWLDPLIAMVHRGYMSSPRMYEHHSPLSEYLNGTGTYVADYGSCPENYEEVKFLAFVKSLQLPLVTLGGAYMPCLLRPEWIIDAGMFPEGNVIGKQRTLSGDRVLYERMKQVHLTVHKSVCYHFHEGEMSE